MRDFLLYFVADIKEESRAEVLGLIGEAVSGGADIVQLRCKGGTARRVMRLGRAVKALLDPQKVPLIINDRADIAAALDAGGVHLGQDDLPVEVARAILGPEKIIGLSTHSLEQALAAQEKELDYFALGPIFPTATKVVCDPPLGTGTIGEVALRARVPWFCIGGIGPQNLEGVLRAGGERIAVVSAIAAARQPREAARVLKTKLEQAGEVGKGRISAKRERR